MNRDTPLILGLREVGSDDSARVGGKNASLGEMISRLEEAGVRVPDGFATTARAYREFLTANDLDDRIAEAMGRLQDDGGNLAQVGREVRRMILEGEFPEDLAGAIRDAYHALGERLEEETPDVAVRSSATAEDLPEASFAGQQETYLHIEGEEALLDACRRCFASLFTDRAISYREEHGFDHLDIALSVGVQAMVRADDGGAGVMFSIDTETGFPDVVVINAAWGLGETVVQGTVDPDEYVVFKPLLEEAGRVPVTGKRRGRKERKRVYAGGDEDPTAEVDTDDEERAGLVLTDEEIVQLARWAVAIEDHYGKPMDMEWAKDGSTGELYVVQARPETVQARKEVGALKTYHLHDRGERLLAGYAIGDAVAAGPVRRLESAAEGERFEDGDILVTEMTDPDWVPIMKRAAAIVTDHGGRTSHAAIVSRELGLPAVIGTGSATATLDDGQEVTVSCAEGEEGYVYAGIADYEAEDVSLEEIPETRTAVMLNLANPGAALRWWRLPADGVGLARMEFVINNAIKIHPLALVHWAELEDEEARTRIAELTVGYTDKARYFVDHLAYGIASIAMAVHPRPIIVRMSDFKTNEYAQLIGGAAFEPAEANPMLGWRGASRYYSDAYREGFALECQAIRKVREAMGLANVVVMIPFCRTPAEADRVLEVMAENGLERGEHGLEVYVMCEIPNNVLQADAFSERFDGFSIGSNDLTQLVLGVDRDSDRLAGLFDEQDEGVKSMIATVIERAHAHERKVGLCGQAPSDHPEFAAFLVGRGIDSISVNPDSFVAVKEQVAAAEREAGES